MSKQIDFSEPLSEEDEAYVNDRPWLRKDAELSGFDLSNAEDFVVESDDDESGQEPDGFEDDENSDSEDGEGDGGTADDESEDEDEGDEDGEEEAAPYTEWDYADLKEEAGNRKLSKAGSKEQLIQRLEEDDASTPE